MLDFRANGLIDKNLKQAAAAAPNTYMQLTQWHTSHALSGCLENPLNALSFHIHFDAANRLKQIVQNRLL
jgi:hypothetical protein